MDAWRPKYKYLFDILDNIIYTAELAMMAAAFMAIIVFTI